MKKSLFFGMAALLAAGITSCSQEDLIVDQNPNLEDVDMSYFAYIDINTTDAVTRAGEPSNQADGQDVSKEPDFDKGNDAENKINTIYLVFYDEDENRISTTQVMRNNLQDVTNTEKDPNSDYQNSLYRGIVQIDVKHGSKKPAYVMAFINPITSQNFDINPDFATLKSLQSVTKPKIIDANDNFAMSKSVYYGPDRSDKKYNPSWDTDPSKWKKIVATPLADGQLRMTSDSIKQLLADPATKDATTVDIYVERYAAKVNLTFKDGMKEFYEYTLNNDEQTKFKFVPEYWAVNAYESKTFICKSFKQEGDDPEDLSYVEMNEALGGTGTTTPWFWNSVPHHRSYWAQTPAYYSRSYPRVADDILDKINNFGLQAAGGYELGYYSYNDLVSNYNGEASKEYSTTARKSRSLQDNADKVRPIYARENTVAGDALHEAFEDPTASPKAAVASVILVGHYEIEGRTNEQGEPDPELDDDEVFYVMGNATNGHKYFENEEDALIYLINITTPFYIYDGGRYTQFYNYGIDGYGFASEQYKQKYLPCFKMSHPSKDVRELSEEPLVIDSRFVTIQLDEDYMNKNGIELFYDGGENFLPVNVDKAEGDYNATWVNQQMLFAAGTVQGFRGGKAFFNVPIKHLGFYRDGNANAGKGGTEKDFQWDKTKSGDFGLVRNHVYTIEVSDIKGLGNAIFNYDDPIVPPTDPEEYFIGARIIVLNWAVVPTQSVVL